MRIRFITNNKEKFKEKFNKEYGKYLSCECNSEEITINIPPDLILENKELIELFKLIYLFEKKY